jgi:hypothetical protein
MDRGGLGSLLGLEFGMHTKLRMLGTKRRGKRFQDFFAEIPGQKLGRPPHRASDLFLFRPRRVASVRCVPSASRLSNAQSLWWRLAWLGTELAGRRFAYRVTI